MTYPRDNILAYENGYVAGRLYKLVMAKQKQKQTSSELQSSSFRCVFGHIFRLARKQGGLLLISAVVAYSAHEFSIAAIAFSGKTSIADVTLKVLASIKTVWTLSISLSGISVTLFLRERSLHRNTRERLTKRITELELRIDPQRTSSKLTSQGLTRKEDE